MPFKIFGGNPDDPTQFAVCDSRPWRMSSACKNFSGQHHSLPKSRYGWVQTKIYYFMENGPKFTALLSLNAGGIVLDNVSFRLSICFFLPEIFAIKFGSCVKSARILHVFGPKIFQGTAPGMFLRELYSAFR